ncbi:MAG TPA: sugar kinase [Thermomicrobiales bacterium]
MSGGDRANTDRVITFGEGMIRFTPPHHERLERTTSLNLSPGGAELNTAVTLACLGVRAAWVSRLPDTPLGRYLTRQASFHGVDVSLVQWVSEREGRTGLYFLEEGTDPRPSAVTYDRAGTAIARIEPGAFDWPTIFQGATAFHISGITPALSAGCRAETVAAIRAANAAGVPVFFDLNYRSKLWSLEEAKACFAEVVPMADVLFAARDSLRTFFGLEGNDEEMMRAARRQLGISVCVLTEKDADTSRSLRLRAHALGPSEQVATTEWRSIEVVDRLGGGDAFAGGFIAAYLENPENLNWAVNLGLAASALKHTMPGDFLCATRAEIEFAARTDAVAVLQR